MAHAKAWEKVCDLLNLCPIGAAGIFFAFKCVNPDEQMFKTALDSQNFNSAMVQFLQG